MKTRARVTPMTSIGDTLRRERLRRNLEIPKISEALKISVRFLDAIEHDDLSKLPGGVFTRSFIRQYAVYLGLDAEELVAEVERSTEPEPEIAELPKPDVPVIDLGSADDWQSVSGRQFSVPSWLRAGVLLVGLMLLCSVIYWWWQRPHHPAVLAHENQPAAAGKPAAPQAVPAVSQPEAAPPTAAVETPKVESTPAAASTPAGTPASVGETPAATPDSTPAPKPEVAVLPPNPNASVRVGLTADEAVWVRAESNGKYLFSGTLQPHEVRNVDVDGEVTIRLGNAGGVTFTLNGKPVGPAGPKGQVRDVQFTSGGLKILSPPSKPDEPLDRR